MVPRPRVMAGLAATGKVGELGVPSRPARGQPGRAGFGVKPCVAGYTEECIQMGECGLGATVGREVARAASSTCCIQWASVCISQPGRWGLTQGPGITSTPAAGGSFLSLFQHGQFPRPGLVSGAQSPAVSAPATHSCGQGAQRGQQGAQDMPREPVVMWARSHLPGPWFSHLWTRAGVAVVGRGQ